MKNIHGLTIPIEQYNNVVANLQARIDELTINKNDVGETVPIDVHNAAMSSKQAELDELTAKYDWLLAKYSQKIRKIFGRSREVVDGQVVMEGAFNEAEAESDLNQPEPTLEESVEPVTKQVKKYIGQKKDKLKGLPIERIDYELPAEERNCSICGDPLPELRPEIRRRIKVIPAQVNVLEEVRHIYAGCKNKCEKDNSYTPAITKAPMPEAAIPHSIASESTIAYVITEKYQYGLPLKRQETKWYMADLRISRQTMANWVILTAEMWLTPLYNRMHSLLLQRDIIMVDESELQVLHEKDRPATSKSYMWLFRSGRDGPPIILFNYQATHEAVHPKKFLTGFNGYLCSDGYKGYYKLPSVINVSCFAHARRYFYDAFMSIPKAARNKSSASYQGLHFCNRLFDVERSICNLAPEARYDERLIKSKPILDEFKAWLDHMRPLSEKKSYLGVAVNYCLNYWSTLGNFLLDGRLDISNNESERQFKGYVVGRKGWLFSNTPKGANASAVVYSIVHTAVSNNLKPYEYIEYLLKTMPNLYITNPSTLDSFLPWSENIPSSCKIINK